MILINKKKVGRPKTDNAMEKRITVRLGEKHQKILEDYTLANDVTTNEAVRKGIEKLEEDLKK